MSEATILAGVGPLDAPSDDAVLLERLRLSDGRAFDLLYKRYARFIAAIAYRVIQDNDEVDDIVQDTFIALDHHHHTIKDPGRVRAWLAVVATRLVRKRLGKRRRRQWLAGEVTQLGPSVSNSASRGQVELLYCELDRIPAKLRLPWSYFRLEGLTLQEVAERCETSTATVKRRIAKATKLLRQRVGEG